MRPSLILLLFMILLSCSGESVTTDYYGQKSLKGLKRIAIAPFHIRTHLPYIDLNFEDQLEFHLLSRNLTVLGVRELKEDFRKYKLKWGELLKEKEIALLGKRNQVDLIIQGSIYEEDRSLFDEGNHTIVHIHFFNRDGKKLATTRYLYSGERSLVSGELIDESIESMLDEIGW